MQQRQAWWLGRRANDDLADFRRRDLVALTFVPDAVATGHESPESAGCANVAESTEAPDACARQHRDLDVFEHEIALGDLVLVNGVDGASLLIGEVMGEPLRRPGLYGMQCVRSVIWRCDAPPPAWLARASADTTGSDLVVQKLDESHVQDIDAMIEAHAAAFEVETFDMCIDTSPPAVALPQIPILFQSPYAERILRDFRWREYLLANPDVAANGNDEAHAFRHFFYQGYYERRIFDPKRIHGFDPGYYRERYPELGLANDAEAQIHYCYQGWYELRVPNRDSAWLFDADLHVFQMGKVGSHTISRGLQDAGYDGKIIHLHWVTDLVHGYPSNRLPYSRILVHERERPVKVISGAREIVSWAISGQFQYQGGALINVRDAVAMIEERFWGACQDGLRWFDHRYFCDLDVYASPFDHASGFTRIEHGGIDLLIYRQEDLSRLGPTFASFLDLPEFAIGADNVGSGKRYATLYREIVRRFRLPGNLLSTLYDSPFMRHFYSDDERQRAYDRWVSKG